MPTYERWKYCDAEVDGKKCGEIADSECTAPGCLHEDHPHFVCREHLKEFDT